MKILAEKVQSLCPTCGAIRFTSKKNKPRPTCRKCMYKLRDQSGEKNPFYGKQHSESAKSKIGKYVKTEAHKEQARQSLKVQGNTKAPYEIWLKKYGQNGADKRMAEYKATMSQKTAGKNNPMYGKPSPVGSGNGWSGWYKEHYFRSILELSVLKKLLDDQVAFENGELDKHAIQYKFEGVERTYFCDFCLTDSAKFLEVKPKKLVSTDCNVAKFAAAKAKHGAKFSVLTEDDIDVINTDVIDRLYASGDLKWTAKWEERYHAYSDLRTARIG